MQKIDQILIVGLGSIGQRHLCNLKKKHPNIKLLALSSKDQGEVEGCKVVPTIEMAISHKPQVAFICNPSSLHIEVATKLVKEGIHLLIEKPLSNALEGIDAFLKKTEASKARIMVAYNLRFKKSLQFFRDVVISKEFGEVLAVSSEVGQYLPNWRPDTSYVGGVSAVKRLGGGALLELSHELDYLLWIFKQPKQVFGNMMKLSDLNIDVEDYISAEIWFKDNSRLIPCRVQLDFLQKTATRFCKMICTDGELLWDAVKDRVSVQLDGEGHTLFQGSCDSNESYQDEITSFLQSIELDTRFKVPIQESVMIMEVVDAIKQSSLSGKVVSL